MQKDTTIPFMNPAFRDELSELVREGAKRIIRRAVEAELGAFLDEHAGDHDAQVRRAPPPPLPLRAETTRRKQMRCPPLRVHT